MGNARTPDEGRIERAELISVGTELLLGEIVDTNSAYLATDLARRGVDVLWSARVGDNLGRIRHLIEQGLERSDLVVLGGGLGPTEDDLTRDAVAAALGEEQTLDDALVAWLEERFASSGRAMPERNLQQARVIPSAEVLPNPIGTAPGWLVRTERGGRRRYVVTLPGPPRELKRMWEEQAAPRLPFPDARIFTRTYKTHGVGESLVAERLGSLTSGANPSVATYAKRDGVHVRVAAKDRSLEAARRAAQPAMAAVERVLGDAVWGVDGDELATLVLRGLAARGLTLAVAEGASGGLLTELLEEASDALARGGPFEAAGRAAEAGGAGAPAAAVPAGDARGATPEMRALAGSVVAWRPETMRTLLPHLAALQRLPDGLAAATAEVVAAVAVAVRTMFAADVGIAVGYPYLAGPASASRLAVAGTTGVQAPPSEDQTEPGTVSGSGPRPQLRLEIALAYGDRTTSQTLNLPPLGRGWARERSAFSGLNLLLRSVLR